MLYNFFFWQHSTFSCLYKRVRHHRLFHLFLRGYIAEIVYNRKKVLYSAVYNRTAKHMCFDL